MEYHFENVHDFQDKHKKIFEVPFNSTNKYQFSIHDMNQDDEKRYFLAMKVRVHVHKILSRLSKYIYIRLFFTRELQSESLSTVQQL